MNRDLSAIHSPSRVRQVVLLFLVLHYANAYVDRVCIAALAPSIQDEFGFDDVSLGIAFSAFSISYGLLQIPVGRLADRFGPRKILTLIVSYWSVFTVATALAWNWISLVVIRFFLGSGEAGAFPSATRAVVRWFAPEERGLVQGLTHSGARFGGAVTPPLAVFVAAFWGWRPAFVLFGLLGFLWAGLWYWYFRDEPEEHPGVNESELEKIRTMGVETASHGSAKLISWNSLLRNRNVLLLSLMYFCYVYAFWIYITWFPTYLIRDRGFDLASSGLLTGLPLLMGTATNTIGGWLSDRISKLRGLRFGRRLVAITGFVSSVLLCVPAALCHDPVLSVLLFTLAAGALELTTGVSWAVAVDIGKNNAGAVSGVMNTFGNLGGALSPLIFGVLVEITGSWAAPFLVASGLCLVGAILWFRIDPLQEE
jgi:sugar phosphate permease